jgi:hypothetical protein
MMFKLNINRPVMSKQHPSSLPPLFPGHSGGDRDSAEIEHGNELLKNI